MPIVKIDLWEGRTREQKDKLIEAVTKVVYETIGCPSEAVQVLLQDYKKEDWGINGKPSSKANPQA